MRKLSVPRRVFIYTFFKDALLYKLRERFLSPQELAAHRLNSLNRVEGNPRAIKDFFLNCHTSELLLSYAAFFPQFLSDASSPTLLSALEAVCNDSNDAILKHRNSHRLTALPAVAAAHLLTHTRKNNEVREQANDIIVSRLRNKNREVKEIVLQALIGSMAPNADTSANYVLGSAVVAAIDESVQQCLEDERLISPLSLSLEAMLNYYLVTGANGAPDKKVGNWIEKCLTDLEQTNHGRVVAGLAKSHQCWFKKFDPSNRYSIPPQRTELLLGWNFSAGARSCWPSEYVRDAVRVEAYKAYTIWRMHAGQGRCDDEIMTARQATISLGKAVALYQYLGWDNVLQNLLPEIADRDFQSFCEHVLPEMRREPHVHGIDVEQFDRSHLAVGLHVPFWSATTSGQVEQDLAARSWLTTTGSALIAGIALGGIVCPKIEELSNEIVSEILTHDDSTTIIAGSREGNIIDFRDRETGKVVEQCLGEAYQETLEKEAELGNALDSVNREIGPHTLFQPSP